MANSNTEPKKRGRKNWNNMSDDQKFKLYQAYERQYDKMYAQVQGNVKGRNGGKFSFREFKAQYNLMYNRPTQGGGLPNRTNIIRRIVREQRQVSAAQADAWARRAAAMGYYKNYREAYKSFLTGDANAQAFWELVGEYGFQEVAYVD